MTMANVRALRPIGAAVAAAAVLVLSGCASEAPAGNGGAPVVTDATLGSATGPGPGRTYTPATAPEGASVRTEVAPAGNGTTATLGVRGLLPNRGYAVHLHTKPCGPTGNDAGPHFQDRVDPAATPEKPSSDPAYANATNEFWLDVRTDATGGGTSSATVPFALTDRRPASVIIHEKMETATAPGTAGTAGGRLACVTL